MADNVNNPDHYQFSNGAQVIDITENLSFNLGNVVKYVARAGRKTENPFEDLMKAQWYLERELVRLDRQFEADTSLPDGMREDEDALWEDRDGDFWVYTSERGWAYQIPGERDWIPVTGTPSKAYGPFKETDLWLNES